MHRIVYQLGNAPLNTHDCGNKTCKNKQYRHNGFCFLKKKLKRAAKAKELEEWPEKKLYKPPQLFLPSAYCQPNFLHDKDVGA